MKKIIFFTIISIFVVALTAVLGIQILSRRDITPPVQKYQEITKVTSDKAKDQPPVIETAITSDLPQQVFSFIYPVDGEIGMTYSPDALIYSKTLQEWTTHKGIDIKAPRGTPVKAAESGIIENISETTDKGIEITISHSNGYKTVYSNLSTKDMVSLNQKIKKAQVISGIGDTAAFEYYEDPHLHFEIIKNGQNINPLKELN